VTRAAILGTGGIARAHAEALKNLGVELVAAADIDPDRLGAFCVEHGIARSYGDAGELLENEELDFVNICTPPSTHAGFILQALSAGAWVLCEKPLCGSLADLDRIVAAERETGGHCASVFQWRFGSAGQHLKRLAGAGALGKSLVGLCQTTWYRDADYYAVPWRGRWATELGGVTMGQGIHAIDLFLWILGDWTEVTAQVATLDREIEVEDVSAALVRFQSGAVGAILNSVLSPHQETYLRFDFQRASVEVRSLYSYANQDWQCTPAAGFEAVRDAWEEIPADPPASHEAQFRAFLESLERSEAPPASASEVRPTLEFISSLYKSGAKGAPVPRGSITPGDPFYRHVAGTLAEAAAATSGPGLSPPKSLE